MKKIHFIVVALLLATNLLAQGRGSIPSGRWWKRPELAQRLRLTPEQQSKLDVISHDAATQLIDLRAELEKGNLQLRVELDDPQPNRADVRKTVMRVNDVRARIFEREVMLLLDIRSVLTEDQWGKLRSALNRPGATQRRHNRRPH